MKARASSLSIIFLFPAILLAQPQEVIDGHVEALKSLLAHGASTDITNSAGQNPLEYTDYLLTRGVSDEGTKLKLQAIKGLLMENH